MVKWLKYKEQTSKWEIERENESVAIIFYDMQFHRYVFTVHPPYGFHTSMWSGSHVMQTINEFLNTPTTGNRAFVYAAAVYLFACFFFSARRQLPLHSSDWGCDSGILGNGILCLFDICMRLPNQKPSSRAVLKSIK